MFGTVWVSGVRSAISILKVCDLNICRVELKGTRFCGRWFKRLRKMGVTRLALSGDIYKEVSSYMRKYGIEPILGKTALEKLAPSIGLFAIHAENISENQFVVEIYTGGNGALNAVDVCAQRAGYIACIGRGSDKLCEFAREKFGVAAVQSAIPKSLCENVLRLYFDASEKVMSVKCKNLREKYFSQVEVELPREYAEICCGVGALPVAELLMEYGKIHAQDV